MNFFYTDRNPQQMARQHCHVLVRKMIVEHAQMLSTNKRLLDGQIRKVWIRKLKETKQDDGTVLCEVRDRLVDWYHLDGDKYETILGRTFLKSHKYYKASHSNHPSTKWARESFDNYLFMIDVTIELCKMYREISGKQHATEDLIFHIEKNVPGDIPMFNFSEPPAVVGDDLKSYALNHGTIKAYQECMRRKFDDWTTRLKPIAVEFLQDPEWLSKELCHE